MAHLADLDLSVLRALREVDAPEEIIHRVNCAPLELQSTLASLRRMGLAELQRSRWSLTPKGLELL